MFASAISKLPKYQPANAFEIMIADGVYKTDPRRFFSFFLTREVLVLARDTGIDGKADIEVSRDIGGQRFAYIYTSEEALNFNLENSGLPPRTFMKLKGDYVLDLLATVGVGMNLNSDVGELIISTPENIRFIIEELKNPTPTPHTIHTMQAGASFLQGVPLVIPATKLNALVGYVRRQSQIEKLFFCLFIEKFGTPEVEESYLLQIVPARGQIDLAEVSPEIGQLWEDVREETDKFKKLPVLIGLASPELVEGKSEALITITKNRWTAPGS